MKVLVKKMKSLGILKLEMVVGAIIMLAVLILLPGSIAVQDASLLLNPFVLGTVLVGMVMFGSFAYFLFIRPYFLYRKSPEVLAETDGEFIYIYGKKQAKIPISAFDGAMVTFQLPFIYSNELIAVLLVHLFSEQYGDIILDVPEYGSFKLRFVSHAKETSEELLQFINASIN